MRRWTFVSFLLIPALSLSLAAQTRPPSTGTTTPTAPTTPTNPTTPSTGTTQRPTMDNDPFNQSPIGIQGRIVPSPGQRLEVELYMDGIRLDQAFTDMDGTFKFPRQRNGQRYELHIQLGTDQEYVEEVEFTGNFPTMIHINERHIRSSRNGNGQKPSGTIISLASLKVPKAAEKEFSKGKELKEKKKYDESLTHLQKAVSLYGSYAEAYNEIGMVYMRQNNPAEAETAYRKAIEVDPKWTYAYLNLAQLQLTKNQLPELLKTTSQVLALDNRLAPAHYYTAIAQATMGNLEEAEKSALAADQSEENKVPQVNWLLGRIYEARGDSGNALNRYKLYLKDHPTGTAAEQAKAAIAKLEAGKN